MDLEPDVEGEAYGAKLCMDVDNGAVGAGADGVGEAEPSAGPMTAEAAFRWSDDFWDLLKRRGLDILGFDASLTLLAALQSGCCVLSGIKKKRHAANIRMTYKGQGWSQVRQIWDGVG